MRQKKLIALIIYIISDFIAASISWFGLYTFRKVALEHFPFDLGQFSHDRQFLLGMLIVPIAWLLFYWIAGFYTNVYRKSRLKETTKTIAVVLIGCVIIFFTLILDDLVIDYKNYYKSVAVLFATQLTLTLVFRIIILNRTKTLLKGGKVYFNTIIIGSNHKAVQLYREITEKAKNSGNRFIGFAEVNSNSPNGLKNYIPQLGNVDDLKRIIQEQDVEEVILAIESSEHDQLNKIINLLADQEVVIKIIPDMYDILAGLAKMNNVLGTALIEIYPDLMPRWEKNVKRIMDIAIASVCILILIPVYLFTALRVKFSSAGPIFFKQERVGVYGKPFYIYKFRSMFVDAEKEGPALSSANDARITAWGRIMRKWRLDEIPQFFNVLKGDMSLVGPRPERQYYIDRILESAPYYKHIQRVKPGITSLGMVKYGYAENVEQMIERLKFDLIYIENVSLLMDMKIMIYTILTVIQGRGK
jgi:exopolysaccharide biosynthesis polyprenyl glycosylphosphotransferase